MTGARRPGPHWLRRLGGPAWNATAPLGTLLALITVIAATWAVRATNGGGPAVRLVVVVGLAAGMAALAFGFGGRPVSPSPATYPGWRLKAAICVAACVVAALGVTSVAHTARTGRIPMDEGQTSWRAGRLLAMGADPYGVSALVDFAAYINVVGPAAPAPGGRAAAEARLAAYDRSLADADRSALLGAVPPNAPRAVFGYKYGPLQLGLGRLAAAFGSPAWIMIENGIGAAILLIVQWAVLRRVCGPDRRLALAAALALFLDANLVHAYIQRSATDVFALTFGSLAVLAHLSRRPYAAGLAVAAAIAFKLLPGALFAPLLLIDRQPKAIVLTVAAAAAAHLPWLVWDPAGLVRNLLVWPFIHSAGASSWLSASPALHLASLAIGGLGATGFWIRGLRSEAPPVCAILAGSAACVLIASGGCADNYLPWVTLWATGAAAEAAGRFRALAGA